MATERYILNSYFKSLGKLISKYRKEKKFSLEELGLQIGLDRSAMHRIENGKPITVTTIIKLALALNKKPKDFFDIDFNMRKSDLGSLVTSKKSSKPKVKKETLRKKK